MRTVILVSGSGSNLQAFIDKCSAGELDLEISLVISNNPEAFGLQRAASAGIPQRCIDHREFDSRLSFDQALIKAIDAEQPELIILAGFMRILTPEFVNHYPLKLINIHPSLLPKYPGTNTHARALAAGDEWHGVSIHYVVPEVDAGPVILQGKLRIKADDTPTSLQQRIHTIEHQLYPLAAQWIAAKRLSVIDGEVLLDNEKSELQLQSFEL